MKHLDKAKSGTVQSGGIMCADLHPDAMFEYARYATHAGVIHLRHYVTSVGGGALPRWF